MKRIVIILGITISATSMAAINTNIECVIDTMDAIGVSEEKASIICAQQDPEACRKIYVFEERIEFKQVIAKCYNAEMANCILDDATSGFTYSEEDGACKRPLTKRECIENSLKDFDFKNDEGLYEEAEERATKRCSGDL